MLAFKRKKKYASGEEDGRGTRRSCRSVPCGKMNCGNSASVSEFCMYARKEKLRGKVGIGKRGRDARGLEGPRNKPTFHALGILLAQNGTKKG